MSDSSLIVNELRRELVNLENGILKEVIGTQQQVSRVDSKVPEVSNEVRSTQEELAELHRQFMDYVGEARRVAAVQRAETKLGTLKADLERDYGHYKVVRRSSIGLLQAFDVGNVSESTANQISEELMVQTPRYWLAPALVALAAWSRDDEDVAKLSVTEAYGRNQAKTALFFALILRREQRGAESVRWLQHYFSSCDPRSLTREFAVILEAASQGQFGPQGTDLVRAQLRTWTTELRNNQELVQEQIDKWIRELTVLREVLDADEAPTLRQLTPPDSFAAVRAQAEASTALKRCAEKYTAIKDSDFTSTGTISSLLDDLLVQLVTEYDDEELPLRREAAYQEAIIDTDGDIDRARTRADQLITVLDERTDAVTLQTNAAISPGALGVSVRTQQVAIGSGREDFRTAVRAYTKDYRRKHVANVPLNLGGQHHGLASALGFVGLTTNTAEDENVMVARLRSAWDQTCAASVAQASFKNRQMVFPIAIAVIVSLLGFAVLKGLGFLVALAAAGIVYYIISHKKKTADAEVAKIHRTKETACTQSLQMLVDARAEFDDLGFFYEEHDADEAELLRVIDVWPVGDATSEGE